MTAMGDVSNIGYPVLEHEVSFEAYQLRKLNELLLFVSQFNQFYQQRLTGITLPLRSLDEFRTLPFTFKRELLADQEEHPPLGWNHSYPESSYVRYHQTSGTTGRPLKVLDTKDGWEWWTNCWIDVLKAAGVTRHDRVFLAFSFGPFIGFWSAYEAAKKFGALVIPGGGQSSVERLNSILSNRATVILCTPSYALHLAEVAKERNLDIQNSAVRVLVHAGEPGASIPAVRNMIESKWGARCYDHAGMTEMGAHSYSCSEQTGLHVNEEQFYAEVIDPQTEQPVAEGEQGELVLTNFGRYGYPLIRYRTGDIVIYSSASCPCGSRLRLLPGGIVGRVDDMVIIRGVNIFPQSIEAIVREFPELGEWRLLFYTEASMDQVKVLAEMPGSLVHELETRLRERLGLRIPVEVVAENSLPRFEMKARRVIDDRATAAQPGVQP